MIINKKRKSKYKLIFLLLVTLLIFTPSAVSAVQVSVSLDGSSTYKTTASLIAPSQSRGTLYTYNSGTNTTVKGYVKKVVKWLPDSTITSTDWLNPKAQSTKDFIQVSGTSYYGQINGQTSNSRGAISLTIR